MKYQQERLYISTFINSFGSWLTFLAIALIVQEKYGSGQVAWTFLVQTLPAILFTRGLSNLVPVKKQERYFFVLQIALALNCLVLCFNQSLPVLYGHLFISALLKSISTPLFNTLIGKWFNGEKMKETFIRVGSIQASTLALAPVAGAWIKIVSSAQVLFALDALSFVLSVVILKELFVKKEINAASGEKKSFQVKDLFADLVSIPRDIPKMLWSNLLIWFAFLILGALLNALEFSGFERLGMKESMIGYALAAWGVGSLIAFIKKSNLPGALVCLSYVLSLLLFMVSPLPWIAVLAFAIAGWASAVFSGILRTNIQASVPEGYNALPVWAFANQITQVINLVAYAGVGLFLGLLGFGVFAFVTIAFGVLVQVYVTSSKKVGAL
jgi:MFS family permease